MVTQCGDANLSDQLTIPFSHSTIYSAGHQSIVLNLYMALSLTHQIEKRGNGLPQLVKVVVTAGGGLENTFVFTFARCAVITADWLSMTRVDSDDTQFFYHSVVATMDKLRCLGFVKVIASPERLSGCYKPQRLFLMITCMFVRESNGDLVRDLAETAGKDAQAILACDAPVLLNSMQVMKRSGMSVSGTTNWLKNLVIRTVPVEVIGQMDTDWAHCLDVAKRSSTHRRFRRHTGVTEHVVLVLMIALRTYAPSLLRKAISRRRRLSSDAVMLASVPRPMSPESGRSKRRRYEYITTFIGEGAYGAVHKARDRNTGQIVAVKRTTLGDPASDYDNYVLMCRAVTRELDVLMRTDHPNVVRMLDHYRTGDRVYIVLEYLPMDLTHFMKKRRLGRILERQAKKIIRKVMLGLAHMHAMGFVHRDVTARNVLISEDGNTVKIADFGLSRFMPEKVSETALSPRRVENATGLDLTRTYNNERLSEYFAEYFPEEIWSPIDGVFIYNERVDTWELGVTYVHILTGKFPVPMLNSKSESKRMDITLRAWNDMLGEHTETNDPAAYRSPLWRKKSKTAYRTQRLRTKLSRVGVSSDGFQVVKSMLRYGRTVRPTVRQLLTMNYFL